MEKNEVVLTIGTEHKVKNLKDFHAVFENGELVIRIEGNNRILYASFANPEKVKNDDTI